MWLFFFVVAQMQQVAWLIFTHRVTHYGILALFSSILTNISYVFFFSSYFLFCAFAFLIFELLFDCRLPVCLVAMHCDKWTLCYFTLAVYIYIYMGCLVRFFFILICFCCLQPNASKASSQSNAIVFDTVL